MSAHAKVTTIAHTAAGMGQVWYRVTGGTGVANVQVAYRVGVGDEAARRVRFVGGGATAEVIGFRPGELLTEPHDFLMVELAFSTCPLVVPLGLIKWHANGTMMTILPKVVAPQHVFRLERTHNPV